MHTTVGTVLRFCLAEPLARWETVFNGKLSCRVVGRVVPLHLFALLYCARWPAR